MVNVQPEALRLADALEVFGTSDDDQLKAAAELRRLHADLNDVQDQRRAAFRMIERLNDELGRVCEQRDELLEGLRNLADLYDTDEGCRSLPEYIAARAAIAKATGETK